LVIQSPTFKHDRKALGAMVGTRLLPCEDISNIEAGIFKGDRRSVQEATTTEQEGTCPRL
jgi:hypothetical protein